MNSCLNLNINFRILTAVIVDEEHIVVAPRDCVSRRDLSACHVGNFRVSNEYGLVGKENANDLCI